MSLKPLSPVLPVPPPEARAASPALPEERPVVLSVNAEPWLTFMCTPADLDALAVGFLYNEGFIDAPADVAAVYVSPGRDHVEVWLRRAVARPVAWRRTSGCLGGATASVAAGLPGLPPGPVLAPGAPGRLMRALFAGQRLYQASGGVHSSALSDGERLVLLAEDIGRHNTLDKLAGRCLLERRVCSGSVLLTTGRLSSEMAHKALRLGTPIVISRSAPTSLAVALAENAGLTLIGYARRDRFNVYTHGWRLDAKPCPSQVGPHASVQLSPATG